MQFITLFKSQGVSIVDHLTAAKQFELFEEKRNSIIVMLLENGHG